MIIYTEDPGVWDAAEALYLGILEAAEAMLQWIDSSAFGMHFSSSFWYPNRELTETSQRD